MNLIRYEFKARINNKTIYSTSAEDTATVENLIAINDDLFEEGAMYTLLAYVDNALVYKDFTSNKSNISFLLNISESIVEKNLTFESK